MLFGYYFLTTSFNQFLYFLLSILTDVISTECKIEEVWFLGSSKLSQTGLCLHVIQMLLFYKFLESVSGSFAINLLFLGSSKLLPVWINLFISCVCMLLRCCYLTDSWNQFLVNSAINPNIVIDVTSIECKIEEVWFLGSSKLSQSGLIS